jgi:transcription elongation factor Elf1
MKSEKTIACSQCDGIAVREAEKPSAIELYRCQSCGHEFPVRIQHAEVSYRLGVNVYKAYVPAGTPEMSRKNRIKAVRVFNGRANFYIEDLDRQIAQGLLKWDLGYYSEHEMREIQDMAAKMEMPVEFIPDQLVRKG